MRAAAAQLRRDALAGLDAERRDAFVDTLLTIKSNLSRMEAAGAPRPSRRPSAKQAT